MEEVNNILALDIGDSRIGIAMASSIAKLPRPFAILKNDPNVFKEINTIVSQNNVRTIVVGLPRNMQGEETAQSGVSRKFAQDLQERMDVEVVFADESLSTQRAERERFKTGRNDSKYLDDVAACFILEEYFESGND